MGTGGGPVFSTVPSEILPGRTGWRHSRPSRPSIRMTAGRPTSGGYRIFLDVTQFDPESAR